jgi:muconolactone delta-isomerase
MLFLVISTPRPEKPTTMIGSRQHYWDWINPLIAKGEVRSVYAKVGRGAVALFDVDSNETLHQYINEWLEIVPAHMEIHALIDVENAKKYLTHQLSGKAQG